MYWEKYKDNLLLKKKTYQCIASYNNSLDLSENYSFRVFIFVLTKINKKITGNIK